MRTSQKVFANNCGSNAARCLLSPCSPTSATASAAQMRSFLTRRASTDNMAFPSSAAAVVVPFQHVRCYSAGNGGDYNNNSNSHRDNSLTGDDQQDLKMFSMSSEYSQAPPPATYITGENDYGGSGAVTASDNRATAEKLWGSLLASPEHLSSAVTGSAGSARITHNLNHGNARWQASCVEVRQMVKVDAEEENPVIAKRNKQFGQQLPWEKTAEERKNKFPKSNKFPADDDVEIVFYFETHDLEGHGLSGYQNIAARVSDGDLPGECSNLTGVGGYATWTVPRSEFVALTESKPLLGDMLSQTAPRKKSSKRTFSSSSLDGDDDSEELRRVTIRMSTAEEQQQKYADATYV